MMLKRNYWLRSGAYSMMQRIAAFVFGFGSYFFLVRYFSVNDFGIWTLYLVVSTSVEMSRSAFIQNAFVKFFNDPETDRNTLFTSSLLLNLLSTLLFITILLGLTPVLQSFWNSQVIGTLIALYCLTSLILIPFTQLNYLEQANHQFSGIFWSSIFRQGTFFLIVLTAYLFYPGLPLIFFAAAHCFTAFLGFLNALYHTRKMLPDRYNFDWQVFRKLFAFGKFILGTGITSTIGKNASQFILGGVGHGLVAKYDAGARIINFMEIPTLSISSIVYPKIAEIAGKSGHAGVRHLYEKSVATIIGIIFPAASAALLFPELVLTITAGQKYLDAAGALQIMALGALFIPFNIQLGTVLEVINRPQVAFYINLFSNILSIILNLILIHFFGVMGAACAFSITLLFIFCIGQWYLRAHLGVTVFRIFGEVISLYRRIFAKAKKSIYLALNKQ